MSTDASACPGCGAKVIKKAGLKGIIFALIIGGVIYKCNSPTTPPAAPAAAIASQPKPTVSAVDSAPTTPASAWSYSLGSDAMTASKSKSATIKSTEHLALEFPYSGANQPRLTIRKNGGGTDVMLTIDKGQIICHGSPCAIKIKFDDGKPATYTGMGPSDHSTTTIFLGPESKLIERIKKSKVMMVELVIYQAGTSVLKFNTAGLRW